MRGLLSWNLFGFCTWSQYALETRIQIPRKPSKPAEASSTPKQNFNIRNDHSLIVYKKGYQLPIESADTAENQLQENDS